MRIHYLLIVVLALKSINCISQDTLVEFDYGRVENNKYVNSYFGLEMTLPENWIVQSKEQLANIVKTGQNMMAGDDENLKVIIKASEVNTANLLAVSQFPKGAAVEYNPSIMIVAENVKNAPGIITGSDYLFHARRLIMQSQFKYDFVDEQFEKEIISGIDFYLMNTGVKYLGLDIKQVYYAAIIKGFSFNIIITFNNDNQKDEILKSIKSLKKSN
jgi:hypothetical protein